MRRLDQEWMLEERVIAGSVAAADIDRLVDRLSLFYRHAAPDRLSPGVHLAEWRRKLTENRSVLLRGELGLPATDVTHVDRVQRRYVDEHGEVFAGRVRSHRIVDGHGDLRPEHVWLGTPVLVIDCLEFSARLRSVDPFDEISYLGIECARLGAPWIGGYAAQRLGRSLHEHPPHHLLAFYRTYRATLRARLAIAHLLEPTPRSPEKWGPLARRYLQLALDDARTLDQVLSENRPLRLRSRGV
jgi:aminoglycoside phosphotransferase family enzyme